MLRLKSPLLVLGYDYDYLRKSYSVILFSSAIDKVHHGIFLNMIKNAWQTIKQCKCISQCYCWKHYSIRCESWNIKCQSINTYSYYLAIKIILKVRIKSFSHHFLASWFLSASVFLLHKVVRMIELANYGDWMKCLYKTC